MATFEDVSENSDILGQTARNYKRNILVVCTVILGISLLPGIDIHKANLFGVKADPDSAKVVLSIFLVYLCPSYSFYAWRDYINWKAMLGEITLGLYEPIFRDEVISIENLAITKLRGLSEAKDIEIKRGNIDTRFRVVEEFTSYDDVKNIEHGRRDSVAYDMPIETWTSIIRGRQYFIFLNVCFPAILVSASIGTLALFQW